MTDLDKLTALARHCRESQRLRDARPEDPKLRRQAEIAEQKLDAALRARERGADLFAQEGPDHGAV